MEEQVNLRRVPKFSGYTKHHKDKGTLGPERDFLSDIFDPISDVSEEVLFRYITVGEFSLFGGVYLHPEDGPKVRNGKPSEKQG